MARNKYPEETVRKILEVSRRLFMERGYDQTTIEDIIRELGMSKGAIYHHFKNKEEILYQVCENCYEEMDWFGEILKNPSFNALRKLEEIFSFELRDETKLSIDNMTLPLLKNPRMIALQLKSTIAEAAPEIAKIIEEGNRDGSLCVSQPREAAEVILLLANLWLNPTMFEIHADDFLEKVRFYLELLHHIGIPMNRERLMKLCQEYYQGVFLKGQGKEARR